MKKSVFLVQPGYLYGNEKKSAYLPYAAGTVAACAFANSEIRNRYRFDGFICFFDAYQSTLQKLQKADVVGFSNYVWNYEYNCELARRLKQMRPNCVIIFGGHQVEQSATPLKELPFVDFLVFGEGEHAFSELLLALENEEAYAMIKGISYRTKTGEILVTHSRECVVSNYPSPYLFGIFDPIFVEFPDVSFIALFETNRGCPFRCAYCDWGTTKDGVKLFPMERISKEIEWFSAHRIESCFAADANFGLFERDEIIASLLIEAKHKTGYPQHFDVTYAKSDHPRVLRIASALYREKMSNGPAISFQSLNSSVLQVIGRKNMSLEQFAQQLKQYEENGLHPYSELILGLPEETYRSFIQGIGTLLAFGQHSYMDIFRCEILPNSKLAKADMRKKYQIETVFVPTSLHHIKEEESIQFTGRSEIVVSTSTMSRVDMLRANVFSMTIQACHFMGLTKYIAIFLFREKNVPYELFYEKLTEILEKQDDVFAALKKHYSAYLQGKEKISLVNAECGGITWFPEEYYFLYNLTRLDQFYETIYPLVRFFLPDQGLCRELIQYQRLFAITPQAKKTESMFSYDFYSFFHGKSERLIRRGFRIYLVPPVYADWEQCARNTVWYGRRRSGTDAFICASEIEIWRE